MAITITCTCDSCKKVVEPKEQLWRIGLTANSRHGISNSGELYFSECKNAIRSADVCRDCLETKFGIYTSIKTTQQPDFQEPSFEEALGNLLDAMGYVRD